MTTYKIEGTDKEIRIRMFAYGEDFRSLDSLIDQKDLLEKRVILDIRAIELSSPLINALFLMHSHTSPKKATIHILDDPARERESNLRDYLEKSRIYNYLDIYYYTEPVKK